MNDDELSEYEDFAQHEGFIFCYTLSENYLLLRLFRLLPIGWVRLDRVANLRSSASKEFYEFGSRRLLLWWKYWFWPYPLSMVGQRDKMVYVIETQNGVRIFIRLRTGMHYMLRTLIGQATRDNP